MPIGSVTPFRSTGTVSLAAGVTSVSIQLSGGGDSVVVTNTSGSVAYVRFGADPSVTASVGDMPVLPGTRVILAINSLISFAAGLLASGNGTVLFTRGDGTFL